MKQRPRFTPSPSPSSEGAGPLPSGWRVKPKLDTEHLLDPDLPDPQEPELQAPDLHASEVHRSDLREARASARHALDLQEPAACDLQPSALPAPDLQAAEGPASVADGGAPRREPADRRSVIDRVLREDGPLRDLPPGPRAAARRVRDLPLTVWAWWLDHRPAGPLLRSWPALLTVALCLVTTMIATTMVAAAWVQIQPGSAGEDAAPIVGPGPLTPPPTLAETLESAKLHATLSRLARKHRPAPSLPEQDAAHSPVQPASPAVERFDSPLPHIPALKPARHGSSLLDA